jgi:hypothetical protein
MKIIKNVLYHYDTFSVVPSIINENYITKCVVSL